MLFAQSRFLCGDGALIPARAGLLKEQCSNPDQRDVPLAKKRPVSAGMVDFLGMFRRQPSARKPRGFARDRMDIGSLGDRMAEMFRAPVRDAPPVASSVNAPPLAPPTPVTPSASRAKPIVKPQGLGSQGSAPQRAAPSSRAGYLAAHKVEKSFGTRKVVHGVSIYVRRGEAVGLLGPNGAGKTTVFYMNTGLIAADKC
jgi:lipopolysaccharide export system ATP-binding protein